MLFTYMNLNKLLSAQYSLISWFCSVEEYMCNIMLWTLIGKYKACVLMNKGLTKLFGNSSRAWPSFDIAIYNDTIGRIVYGLHWNRILEIKISAFKGKGKMFR